MRAMSRTAIAVPLGLLGFLLYLGAVLLGADLMLGRHWALQGLYFLLAGTLWAWPAHKLMLWAGGK